MSNCNWTLPTSAQEVFDTVCKHLLQQNAKSLVRNVCMYRGPHGMRCAAGCLIPDQHYHDGFENRSWHRLIVLDMVPNKHADLIEELQSIHDVSDVSEWRRELRELGERLNLSTAKLESMLPDSLQSSECHIETASTV